MIEPIVVEFEVDAAPAHAFDVWTARSAIWWPRSHTVSGSPELDIVFEPFAGGRVFERSGDGSEHDWGRVVEWEPPHRVAYTWHLFFDPAQATDITVTFEASNRGTRVRLAQTGFERLGLDVGPDRRDRTDTVWKSMTALYRTALAGA